MGVELLLWLFLLAFIMFVSGFCIGYTAHRHLMTKHSKERVKLYKEAVALVDHELANKKG